MSLLSWWAPVWDFPFLPADFGLWTFWSFLTDIIILNSRESGLSFLSLEDSEFLYAKCLTPSIMAQKARERHHLCLLMVRMSCESLNSEQGGAYYPYSLKSKTGAFIFFKKKKISSMWLAISTLAFNNWGSCGFRYPFSEYSFHIFRLHCIVSFLKAVSCVLDCSSLKLRARFNNFKDLF